MASDKKEGKGCMVFMNVLLLILGLFIIGLTIYVNTGSDIPPVIQQLGVILGMGIGIGVVLVIFSIIGFCASCGGCFLFIYCVVITILSIICVVLTIAVIIIWVGVKNLDDTSNAIVSLVDNTTINVISQPDYQDSWKSIQNALNCCGYQGFEETGDSCSASPQGQDCRNLIFGTLVNYSLVSFIVILVATVVVIILNCASCARMKSDCRN